MQNYICSDCPRRCGVPRGQGYCRMGAEPVLARAALHFDEEPVISGTRGTGAVFFSGCSLQCVYCQNFEVSHHGLGKPVTVDRLKEIYRELIAQGATSIDLVNPTHFARAVYESLEGGLPVPVIWNSGGYDTVETLRRFEGRVNVYLPDLKYITPEPAGRYSGAPDYFAFAAPALREMLRQTGPVELDDEGIIRKGVIIRHLILPGRVEESKSVLDWIAENMPGAWISLMAQYLPFGEVQGIDQLERRLYQEEYDAVVDHLMDLGLEDGFVQELSSSDEKYIPKFNMEGV